MTMVIDRVARKVDPYKSEMMKQMKESETETLLETPDNLYDLNQLEEIAAGNNDFLTVLAQIYLNTIPGTSTEMVEATKSGEWVKASKLAHKLKSTIDSLNMHSIVKDIRSIEVDGKNKVNTENLKNLALKVDVVIKKVAEQIKEDFSL